MKLIDRYIINNFLWNFLGIIFICTIVFVVYILIDLYEDILSNAPSFYYVALYFVNSLPFLLVEVIPLAVAISVLLMVGNMAKNYEIIALLTNGISQLRIATPLLIVALIMSIGLFLFSELIVPGCQRRARYIEKAFIEGKGEQVITRAKDVFVKGKGNRFYLMKHYDDLLKRMTQPVIIETDSSGGKLRSKIVAKMAEFVERQSENSIWRFYNLEKQEYDDEGNLKNYQKFNQPVDLPLERELDKFLSYKKEPEEMNLWELKSYLSILKNRGENVGTYATDLHLKISFPLGVIIVMLICFSFATRMQIGNLVINFAQALMLVVAYYALIAFTRAMGHNMVLPPLIAGWSGDLVFALIGIAIFKRNSI